MLCFKVLIFEIFVLFLEYEVDCELLFSMSFIILNKKNI